MSKVAVHLATAFCLLAATTSTAGAQNLPGPQSRQATPITPGGVRITARNPLQGNWICSGNACACKPLACGAASRVSYFTAPTPARNPNPQALEKFAKIEVPKRVRATNAAQDVMSDGKNKFEMLASKVATHLGYPSVLSETRFIKGESRVFIATAMIFAGPVLLTVTSASTERGVALSSLNEFIRAMTIEEDPPLHPRAPPPSPVPPAIRSTVPDKA